MLFVQYMERGSSCPTKSGHLWAIPKVFGSCLNRSLNLAILKSFPLVSATCNWVPAELMQTGSCRVEKAGDKCGQEQDNSFPCGLGDEMHSCGCTWIVLAAESQGSYTDEIWEFLGYKVLGHGVKVWCKQHCAKLTMGSCVGEPKGQELAQGGQSIEVGDVSNA